MKNSSFLFQKMSRVVASNFKTEIQSSALRNLGLPSNVLQNKVITVTDAILTENGKRILSLHYNPSTINNVLAGKYPYSPEQIRSIKNCRGIQVDADTGVKELQSWGMTEVMCVDSVPLDGFQPVVINGKLVYPTQGKYTKCYGGALARISKVGGDGPVLLGTHRKINAEISHYGLSDGFVKIFLTRQNVFPTLDSIYDLCDSDIVHLFILNDRELLIDTREFQDKDRIVYLKSYSVKNPEKTFDLTAYIELRNKDVSKPIEICRPLSNEEVNQRLRGRITCDEINPLDIVSHEDYNNAMRQNTIKTISGGDCVIYDNEYGIFTLMPNSCSFRRRIMDGKVNIKKLFVDSVANFAKSELQMIAYSPSDLREIAIKIRSGESYNLYEYTVIDNQPLLTVLTNLFFIVPEHRIDECFDIFESYGMELLTAIQYIISIKRELIGAIADGRLDTYDGMASMGVKFRSYIEANIPVCLNSEFPLVSFGGPQPTWPNEVCDFFGSEYSSISQTSSNSLEKNLNSMENLKLICIVTNSQFDDLYSFISYKNKVIKERAALEKRLLRTLILPEDDSIRLDK